MYYGEKFNAVTHLVGATLALAGAIVLVVLAGLGGDPWKVVSVSIYGVTLVMLYTSSVLYHSLQGRPKDVLRKAKILAVQKNTSLSGLLTQALADLVAQQEAYEQACQRSLTLLEHGLDLGTHGKFDGKRADLHER